MIMHGMIVGDRRDGSRLALVLRTPGGAQPKALALCGLSDRPLTMHGECPVYVYTTKFYAQLWNAHTVSIDAVEYIGIRVDDMAPVWATDGDVEPHGPATTEMMRRARSPWAGLAQRYAASLYSNDDPPHRIVVCGGAACVWDDLAAIPDGWADCWVACNRVGTELPQLDHWVTEHPEHYPRWEAERVRNGHPAGYVKWSRTYPYGVEVPRGIDQFVETIGASSGGLAARLAQNLLAPNGEAVLCGIPMDYRPHYYTEHPWEASSDFQKALAEHAHLLPNVRSMRGWTRELLGAPSFAE